MCRLVLAAVVLMAISACSSAGSSQAGAPLTSPTSTPTGSPTVGHPSKKPTTEPTTQPQSPSAPAKIKPVVRNGNQPHPSVSAAPQSFDQAVTYPDGVRLAVSGIHQGRVSGQGIGVVAGPRTTFDLRFTNGSNRAIDLNQVVPTAVFGKPGRIAQPVYNDSTQDFGGVVRPGASTTSSYAFSIPVRKLGDVTIHLDFDGRHYAAVFHGSVTS